MGSKARVAKLTAKIDDVIAAHPKDGRDVYFVQCQEFVKIGSSLNSRHRASSLRGSTPFDQLMIASVPASLAAERALHEFFAFHRSSGEWFRMSRDQRHAIVALPDNRVRFLSGYRG